MIKLYSWGLGRYDSAAPPAARAAAAAARQLLPACHNALPATYTHPVAEGLIQTNHKMCYCLQVSAKHGAQRARAATVIVQAAKREYEVSNQSSGAGFDYPAYQMPLQLSNAVNLCTLLLAITSQCFQHRRPILSSVHFSRSYAHEQPQKQWDPAATSHERERSGSATAAPYLHCTPTIQHQGCALLNISLLAIWQALPVFHGCSVERRSL